MKNIRRLYAIVLIALVSGSVAHAIPGWVPPNNPQTWASTFMGPVYFNTLENNGGSGWAYSSTRDFWFYWQLSGSGIAIYQDDYPEFAAESIPTQGDGFFNWIKRRWAGYYYTDQTNWPWVYIQSQVVNFQTSGGSNFTVTAVSRAEQDNGLGSPYSGSCDNGGWAYFVDASGGRLPPGWGFFWLPAGLITTIQGYYSYAAGNVIRTSYYGGAQNLFNANPAVPHYKYWINNLP